MQDKLDIIVALSSFYEETQDLREAYDEANYKNEDLFEMLDEVNHFIIQELKVQVQRMDKKKKKKKNKNKNNN